MENGNIFTSTMAFAIGLILGGLILFMIGLMYRFPLMAEWDKNLYIKLNTSRSKYQSGFVYLWHLGTTPVAIVLIAMTFLNGVQVGLLILMVYMTVLLTENILKRIIGRDRPFIKLSNALLTQPTRPKDPSFPSGDAMRVSFLALVIPTVFNLQWNALLIACLIALVICANRIALGAHYPLDVVGGIGLGVLGGGCTLLLSSVLPL